MAHEIFTPGQGLEVLSRLKRVMVWIHGRRLHSAAWFSMEELCSGEWRFTGDHSADGANALTEAAPH